MSRSKAKGTNFESELVNYLHENGYAGVERRALAGIADRGDLAGLPGWTIEAKAVDKMHLGQWVLEAEKEAANAATPYWIVAHKRKYKPVSSAWATMPLHNWVSLLLSPGVEPLPPRDPASKRFADEVASYLTSYWPGLATDQAGMGVQDAQVSGVDDWCVHVRCHGSLDLAEWSNAAAKSAGSDRMWAIIHSRRLQPTSQSYVSMPLWAWINMIPRAVLAGLV